MAGRPASGFWASLVVVVLAGVLGGCSLGGLPKDLKPVPRALTVAMHDQGMDETAPIFIRIFKEDSELEVWKQKTDGQYALLKTYSICQWSGELGPKKVEGDKQAPEGFYTVTPAQMNPNSEYYLSFNIGYPNAYDQSLGRTGGNLMVHGACSSAGCYSMTDESAGEIFALARDAFKGGQREFQVQAFPFRMTPENMAKHADNPNMDFWRMLKVGYDSFDITHTPPKIDVCDKHYVFDADAGTATFDPSRKCPAYKVPPAIAMALAQKQAADNVKFTAALAALRQSNDGGTQVATIEPVVATTATARPSLLDRFGFGGRSDPAPTPPATAAAPVTTATASTAAPTAAATAPAAPPTTSVVASVPRAAATTPKPVPKPATTATVTAPAGPSAAAITAGSSDPIGVLVNRKFWWDDVPLAAGTPGA